MVETHRTKKISIKRKQWIDVFRGLAISAVVLDHIMFLFEDLRSEAFWHHTSFSVPWFIFLAGVTNTISVKKHASGPLWKNMLSFWWRRSSLLGAYVAASVICYLILHQGHIQKDEFLWQLEFFFVQRTYYFINIILQLYILFPLLIWLLRFSSKSKWVVLLSSIGVMAISLLVLPLWVPPWPFSVAQHLFGGMYVAVFWLGMLIGWYGIPQHPFTLILSADIFILSEWPLQGTVGNFLGLFPTVPYLLWGMSLLVLLYSILQYLPLPGPLNRVFSFLGRYSLGIYLYHFLLLQLLVGKLPPLPWGIALASLFFLATGIPAILLQTLDYLRMRSRAILSAITVSVL